MKFANTKYAKGFTLIELMIVIVIIGILAAVAMPQYKQYVIRGNRAATQSFMMDIASRQKQYLLDARVYAPTVAALSLTVPVEVSKNYTITMDVPAGAMPAFTITATPVAGKPQADDGVLTLDDTGTKTPVAKW